MQCRCLLFGATGPVWTDPRSLLCGNCLNFHRSSAIGASVKKTVDHYAFGIARRRWRVPLTVLCTNLPSFDEVVECRPSRFRCQGGHQHHAKQLLVTEDAGYIPNELSELLARCVCSETDLFVRAGAHPLSDDGLWQFFRHLDLYFSVLIICVPFFLFGPCRFPVCLLLLLPARCP